MFSFDFDAIGTSWKIDTVSPLDEPVRRRILARIERFDASFSRFRPDSDVATMAGRVNGGRFTFPTDAVSLFDLYDRLYAATAGAVDPLVGRDLELLGYDAAYSFRHDPSQISSYSHERRSWQKDVHREGSNLFTRRSVVLDVGAAGKGFIVDVVGDLLRQEGFDEFVVDAGGDLIHAGREALRVGLEHPLDAELVIGVANLRESALCASAVNRRTWGNFHHVLDGRTGIPARDVIATWAMADNAMTSDGLATALFFTSAEALSTQFAFVSVRMFAGGGVEVSPNFDGEIFFEQEGAP